jgi:hypothetical protein
VAWNDGDLSDVPEVRFELDQRAMQAGLKCDRVPGKPMNDQRVPTLYRDRFSVNKARFATRRWI